MDEKNDHTERTLKEQIAFMGNPGSDERERWVLDQWLSAKGNTSVSVEKGNDPPDFLVDGEPVEVTEVLPPNRKRHQEYKDDLHKYRNGEAWGVHERPGDTGDLRTINREAGDWILGRIKAKEEKYANGDKRVNYTLLVYVNLAWADRIDWGHITMQLKQKSVVGFKRIEAIYSDHHGIHCQVLYP